MVRTIAVLRVYSQAAFNRIVWGIVQSLFPLAVLMTTLNHKLCTISVSDLKELYVMDCNTLELGHFILELDELYDYVLKKNTIVDINLVGQF